MKNRNRVYRRASRARGILVLEMASAVFLLLIFTLLSLHISLLMYGASINDRACRDAARAAAQGQSPTEATQLASTILESHDPFGSYIGAPRIRGPVVYQDFGGSPPDQQSPFVRVTTETKVNMPFALLRVCGETLRDGNVSFVQSYTFPIVRVK